MSMNEYEKAMRILGTNRQAAPVQTTNRSNHAKNYLVSGDSRYERGLIAQSASMCSSAVIVASQEEAEALLPVLRSLGPVAVVGNDYDTLYNPFTGHAEETVREMLASVCEHPSHGLLILIRIVAQIAMFDSMIIAELAQSFTDINTFDEILSRALANGRITQRQYDTFINALQSCSSYFLELDAAIGNLPNCVRGCGGNGRIRTNHSIGSLLSANRIVMFVFKGSNAQRESDKALLKLLSMDLDDLRTAGGYALILADPDYQRVQFFTHLFDRSDISVVLYLRSSADYVHNQLYKQVIKSKFDVYCIFCHFNSDMCGFWSDMILSGEVAEFSYGNSQSRETATNPGMFWRPVHRQQNASSVNVQYNDRNIVRPYEIRDIPEHEYILLDKHSGRFMKCSVV